MLLVKLNIRRQKRKMVQDCELMDKRLAHTPPWLARRSLGQSGNRWSVGGSKLVLAATLARYFSGDWGSLTAAETPL